MADIYKPNIQKVSIEAVIPELVLAEPLTVEGEVSIDGTVDVEGTVSVSNFPATQPVSGTVTIQDGGNIITVDGTVGVSNFPSVQPVSDNGGSLSVDDGGGSITVDGTVSIVGATSSTTVAQIDIAITATQILASPLTGRKTVVINNHDTTNPVYLGFSSGVVSTNGFKIAAGYVQEFPFDASVSTIYLISTGGTVRISYMELN